MPCPAISFTGFSSFSFSFGSGFDIGQHRVRGINIIALAWEFGNGSKGPGYQFGLLSWLQDVSGKVIKGGLTVLLSSDTSILSRSLERNKKGVGFAGHVSSRSSSIA